MSEIKVSLTHPDGTPKTEKELEKERKKAEKMAKFAAKQAKKQQAPAGGASTGASSKAPKASKPKEEVPKFVDTTTPGDKKVLLSLDDPALKAYIPANVESSWYDWWVKQGFFEPKLAPNGDVSKAGQFVIPAPPPNVTGALHIGHALTISLQDTLVRYNRMRGRTTLFIPGFDHAGISTQSVVEKNVWKQSGKTRHDFGREKFVDLVWQWKEEYHARIKSQITALGASYDWSREAFTMDPKRYAAVEEAFVRLFEDGSLYRAKRLVNWSVALRTTLSNLEVVNKEIPGRTMLKVPGYSEPVEFGVITSFAYPVVGSDEKLVVATTRPETVFGDTAVAVHPEDPRYKHLHGKKLQHPLLPDREVPVICDAEAVDMEFGTGAVKITPAHDPNDYETGKRHDLAFVSVIDDDGLMNAAAGPEYAGMKRFDARARVIEDLKQRGLFVEQKENPMAVPTCDKSGDVIEPMLKPQWWLDLGASAKKAISAVKEGKITVYPKSSESEYFHWLENLQDWCISRQLWWGHRCPVYLVEVDGEKLDSSNTKSWVAGRSESEAHEKAAKLYPGKQIRLYQDEDVLDTWFSSGLWPMTTLGWPNVDSADFKNFFPMSMLETGWDILFFWVTRMIMLSLHLTGEIPFKEVYCHSLVRDAQGRKMSKSLGNVVDPLDVITGISLPKLHDKLKQGNLDPAEVKRAAEGQSISFPQGIPECGTDALRFAMCAYTSGGRDINLDIYRVEGYRKFCNKIYQATKFALMRLGSDYAPPSEPTTGRSLVEKWILHKLSSAGKLTAEHLERRQFMDATSVVYNFWLYEFCDVYIENSKSLILEGSAEEKQSAQNTLYTCLDGALRLIHPFMPFLTEELWQRIPKRASAKGIETVCLAPFPLEQLFDDQSERAYTLVLEVAKSLRSLFADYSIPKNGEAIVNVTSAEEYEMLSQQNQSILSIVKQAAKLEITKDADAPKGCAVGTVSPTISAYVVVKGHVDLDVEIKKASDKIAKVEQQRANVIKQTQVPGYEEKVKDSVKEANVKKLEGFEAELKGLDAVIKEFERLKL